MGDSKEEFHILGPKARGVQLTFHITEKMKPEKNILWANNMKYNIQLSPDFGNYALRILCRNSELYQIGNILGFNSDEILDFIVKLNNIMINTIKSSLDLSELEDLQKLKKNQSIDLIKKEIRDGLLPNLQIQIDKLKNKITTK